MKAPSLRYLLALTWLLAPGVATAGEAPEAQVFGLLMEELSYESRQERLAETFSQLDRDGQLTPALYRKLLAHPSGRMFLPDLNAALARSDAQRATAIFGSLLKAPPDLPSDSRLDVRRATAYALSQLTASNRDEQLFALQPHRAEHFVVPKDVAARVAALACEQLDQAERLRRLGVHPWPGNSF